MLGFVTFTMLAAAAGAGTPALDQGKSTVDFVARYCLGEGFVAGKKALMESDGWREEFDREEGWPSDLPIRLFRHPDHPQLVLMSTPDNAPEKVRDCTVDGEGIDATQVIDAAIERWGKPEKGPDNLYYWPTPKEFDQTVILANSLVAHDPKIAAFSLTVRYGQSPFPEKEP
jgi:hypothetical protein